MRRILVLLAVVGSVLLMAFAGVAWAADVFCSGGRCEGTEQSDRITGSAGRDLIVALGGQDDVVGLAGRDELHGNNGGDFLAGSNNGDIYFGGDGSDFLSDFESFTGEVTQSGPDVMYGGDGEDFLASNTGQDILRGQDGDECGDEFEGQFELGMIGGGGDDDLYGGSGEDCLAGEEGTDVHLGGPDNDFIDAVDRDGAPETDEPVGTHDLVNCGDGLDTAIVNRDEDIVRANCENVVDVASTATRVVAPPGTTDEERQQLGKAFLAEHGLQP
jgi:RTX calcium-binding nonapeptide repeat (4 copies)